MSQRAALRGFFLCILALLYGRPILGQAAAGTIAFTPDPVQVRVGETSQLVTATIQYVGTPPGGSQTLLFNGGNGLSGAVISPSPVTFTPVAGGPTTVSFQLVAAPDAYPGPFEASVATTGATGLMNYEILPFSVAPASVLVGAGNTVTGLTATVSYPDFTPTGPQQLTFSGLPAGATPVPSPVTFTVSGTSAVVGFGIATSPATPPGSYTVTVGTTPTATGTDTFELLVVPGSSIAVAPSTTTVLPGATTPGLTATVAFGPPVPTGPQQLVFTGLPPGATPVPSPVSFSVFQIPTVAVPFSVATSPATPPGVYVVTVGTSPASAGTASFELVVAPPGRLELSLTSSSIDVCPGGPAVENSATVTPAEGFEGSAEVTFPLLPAELVVTPLSIPVEAMPPAQTVSFAISARPDATPGQKVVVVRAASPFGVAAVATFAVNVAAPGFTPVLAPAALTLTAGGGTGKAVVSLAPSACPTTAETILVTPSGLPAGVTVTPGSAVLFGPTYPPVEFTFVAASAAPAGAATATFAFEPSGGAAKSLPLPITVQRPGRLAIVAERPTMELCAGGGEAPNTLTVNGLDGYTGTPTVTFPGLPAGITATPATIAVPSVPPARVLSFTLRAAAGLAAGDRAVTVKVADPNGVEATTTVVARVLPPDFAPSVAPSNLVLNAGGAAGTITASLTPGSCPPSTDVTITPSGLPPGVVVTPSSALVSPPDFGPALFTFLAGAGAEPGPSTITFTWAPNGATPQTTTATITVCGAPAAPGSPAIRPAGNPEGPVTATDFLDLSWAPPASGYPATRYDWRINGGAWTSAAGTFAAAPPRGAVDPVQLFVRAFACDPEKGPGAEASSPVYSLAPPQASFAVPSSVVAGQPATFTDTSSPQATSWLWFPGDGMPATTVQSPTVTFPSAGPRVIVLVATNGSGTSTKSMTVNVLPASAVRTAAGSFVRRLDRQPDGRLALDEVDVARGTTLLLRRLSGAGDAVAFLRLVDTSGAVAVERRLVLAEGEEARHELFAWGGGRFRVELVGPEGLEATVVTSAAPAPAPELPVPPREPRRIEPR
ncbi:MAG TPA: PKD domain-containing protein [Thermoanaerobaculia bacterium]|nr:PKD domain-containing protein [Thermoanaerobaculia bacterium]